MQTNIKRHGIFLKILLLIGLCFLLVGCASYRWGSSDRTLPGGYQQIFIPVFKNYSAEPGIEIDFTNAIRREFARSQIARVTEPGQAEVDLVGEITNLYYQPEAPKSYDTLPTETVINTQYSINLKVHLKLRRRSDGVILWQSDFSSQKTYVAPRVTIAGVNTVNPLYNLSARRINIQIMSEAMMIEAHDRLTENF